MGEAGNPDKQGACVCVCVRELRMCVWLAAERETCVHALKSGIFLSE